MKLNKFNLEIFKKRLPLIEWCKNYDGEKAISDFVAGITVGLTLIPQSIAYASLAGLDPQYGLYSSLCGGFTYAIFGTIPEINIAPTSLISLLTYSYTQNLEISNVSAAVLLCFISGIVELLCGILHLGFLLNFVSIPVVSAFTSAGAITIVSALLKNFLGLDFQSENFLDIWKNIFDQIGNTKIWDATLGVCCCVILFSLKKLREFGLAPFAIGAKNQAVIARKILWFICTARNAIVVISCALIAFLFRNTFDKFSLTPQVPNAWPTVNFPFSNLIWDNSTTNETDQNVLNAISEFGTGLFLVPFISILANVAIAKALSKGNVVDASQEMIALGMCNTIGSFFSSYPVNASFSRGALSKASGATSPLVGIYVGIMVIMSFFLTPYFAFIPKATLSAVLIVSVIFMVEFQIMEYIWKINRIELLPFLVTFISCLLIGIELGILIGISVDVVMLLYTSARPDINRENIKLESSDNKVVEIVKIIPCASSIQFPSAEYLRYQLVKLCNQGQKIYIVIDCQNVKKLDFTAAKCIQAFIDEHEQLVELFLICSQQRIIDVFLTSCKSLLIFKSEPEFLIYFKETHFGDINI